MNPRVLLRTAAVLTLALAGVGVSGPLGADTFRLAGGKAVTGELLKERPDSYVVDLGFEVVVIPKDTVEEHLRGPAQEVGAPARPAVQQEAPRPADGGGGGTLYRTVQEAARGVRETAQRFGPAVVTVTTPSGLGSGFVIDDRGHVVTNAHVIQRETRISLTVFLPRKGPEAAGGAKLERKKIDEVRIVALNPYLDLALLEAPQLGKLGVPAVYLGESETLRLGQQAFAIGAPLGLERSVSQGIVSSTQRNLRGMLYLQTTAAINPGNSGGPLFDARGRVVGVINAKVFGAEGVGFAIPVLYLKHFLDHYEAFAYDKDNPNTGYHYLSPPGVISLTEASDEPRPAGRPGAEGPEAR